MTELLKELKLGNLDWKGFLLSGICPALLFSFGVIFCMQGWGGVEHQLESLQKFKEFVAKSIVLLGANLVAAFLLYVLRPVTLQLYRRVPIPIWRSLMLWWSAWKRRRARKRTSIALWRLNVARWVQIDFPEDQFVVLEVLKARKTPDIKKTVTRSAQARKRAETSGRWTWNIQRGRVFSAFEKLHLLTGQRTRIKEKAAELAAAGGRSDSQNWADAERILQISAPDDRLTAELKEWRDLYRRSLQVQDRIGSFDNHVLLDRYRERDFNAKHYPDSDWIEPTRVGNIFAALEDYAEKRYGMNTAKLWSRLEAVVPQQQREQIVSYQSAVSSLLHAHLALWLLAVFAVVEGFIAGDRREWFFAACSLCAAYLCNWLQCILRRGCGRRSKPRWI